MPENINDKLKQMFAEELRELRKKGWGEAKIARWLEMKRRDYGASGPMEWTEPALDPAWTEITDKTADREIMRRWKEDFGFRGSTARAGWPSIVEPVPSVTYEFFTAFYSKDINRERVLEEFQLAVVAALRKAVRVGETCIAFDPHHRVYAFDPNRFEHAKDASAWAVPAFPNGDYSIFVTRDWSAGIFGIRGSKRFASSVRQWSMPSPRIRRNC